MNRAVSTLDEASATAQRRKMVQLFYVEHCSRVKSQCSTWNTGLLFWIGGSIFPTLPRLDLLKLMDKMAIVA